ncbi:hypothetical protein ACTXT7_004192 [Hymenolepis weldensis]
MEVEDVCHAALARQLSPFFAVQTFISSSQVGASLVGCSSVAVIGFPPGVACDCGVSRYLTVKRSGVARCPLVISRLGVPSDPDEFKSISGMFESVETWVTVFAEGPRLVEAQFCGLSCVLRTKNFLNHKAKVYAQRRRKPKYE